MGRRMTEGRKLRRRLDAALAAEAARSGQTLEWDDRELEFLALAESAADRRAALVALLDAEQADGGSTALIVKLNTEIRAQDRALVDLLNRIQIGEGPAKSTRHQKAVQARWDRHRQRQSEVHGGAYPPRPAVGEGRSLVAALVAHWDELIDFYGEVVDMPGGECSVAPWPHQIALVEAGRPVVVERSTLAVVCRRVGLPGPPAGDRFRVDASGIVTAA